MIITEYYKTRADGVILNKTYSNTGHYIVRDGVEYSEAIDPAELNRTYSESENIIRKETSEEITADEALAELMEVLE